MKSFISKLRVLALLAISFVVASYPWAVLSAATAKVYEALTGPFLNPEGGRHSVNGALTLTNLIPTIYAAMDTVSREQTGFIRAVGRDSGAERAAVGESVLSPVVGPMAAENLNVGAYAADTPAQTIGNVSMTISKARSVPFGITGEENKGLNNAGTLATINRARIAQALRTLSNEVEDDLSALHVYASRAYGTATGTPFNTAADLSDFANPLRILEENGAPTSDLHMVLDSASVGRIRSKQSSLFKVNEAGSEDLLRYGRLGSVQGIDLHWSPKVKQLVTVGACTATVDATGYAVGATTLTLSAAACTLIVGDIVSFAGDSNQYVVAGGTLTSGGTLIIAEPGLKVAMSAATKAITVVAATTRNMFFYRGAIQLATRAPAMPDGGDCADDVMMITDPVSGISYEFCLYRQKRQIRYEVNLAWGVKAVQPRHIGLLIGA